MKRYLFSSIIIISIILISNFSFGDDTELFMTQAKPNILIILDNSNSMDEDFYGNAVGSYSPSSKSVVAKKAIKDIIEKYKTKLRFGLMSYRLPSGVSSYYLHNSPYFVSYNPKSYCPDPPKECVEYAKTGSAGAKSICETGCKKDNPSFDITYFDEILINYPIGSEQRDRYSQLIFPKRQKKDASPNSTIYYKNAYPFYSTSNMGTAFCYSSGYNPNEGTPWDNYTCYRNKTGENDDGSNYSNSFWSGALYPTDSDYALGYLDFGRRLQWYYVGRTWFSNSSPGDGYLHVSIGDLLDKKGNPTTTYTNLLNKLDPKENDEAGYMSCGSGDRNACSYIVNAGLTPTAGTLETAIKYFKGEAGYTSPIQDWCQKNFIIYVTDGLPSVDESGTPNNADNLMPAVLSKLDYLRTLQVTVKGKINDSGVKTYILGVGLSDEAKLKLNEMAIHGGTDVDKRAFYADKPSEMVDALENIFTLIISGGPYYFSSPSIPSIRIDDTQDYIAYIASFIPSINEPFWPGYLKAYQLDPNGTFPVDEYGKPKNPPLWSASIPSANERVVKTVMGGLLKDFSSPNLTPQDLDVENEQKRNELVSYIRSLPLGDIFHSNPVIVGSPSMFFNEEGYRGAGGFYEINKNRKKVVIVGANDGMLHAFDTSNGKEIWAFIPNSLLKNLKSMLSKHTYYVDSTPKVADIWIGDKNSNGKKDSNEWRTVLICGLRKGGKHYFALDITDTTNPQYLWEFPKSGDTTTLAKIGESWSEPAIGRIKVEEGGKLVEKWVAFIGGGFDPTETKVKDATVGRAFFVIDAWTGDIIWEFSYDPSHYWKKQMTSSLPASPAAVDTNFDGYIDKVYIGDLGGKMWVFDVSFDVLTQKSNSLWTDRAKILFKAPSSNAEKHNIYYQPAIAFDRSLTPWVYFGTGNREEPKDNTNPKERFYAVKDDGLGNIASGTYPLREEDLLNLIEEGINTFAPVTDKKGWFIKLEREGQSLEKVLARPVVFNRIVYFTTYTNVETEDLCSVEGIGKVYMVYYLSGGGALNVDDLSDLLGSPSSERSKIIGQGAPSTPVITVSRKGKASIIIGESSGAIYSQEAFSEPTNKELLYWREVIQ